MAVPVKPVPKTMDFTPSAIINTDDAAATALEFRFLIKPEKEPAKRSGRKLPAPRAAIIRAPSAGSAVEAALTPAAYNSPHGMSPLSMPIRNGAAFPFPGPRRVTARKA